MNNPVRKIAVSVMVMILLLFVLPQIAPNLHIVDRLIFPPVQWLGSWYQSIAQAVAGPEMN